MARPDQGVMDDSATALVHYTGLHGTARMAQATENDVGLPKPVSLLTAPGTDSHAPSNVSNHTKNCVLNSYRFVSYTTDCKRGRCGVGLKFVMSYLKGYRAA